MTETEPLESLLTRVMRLVATQGEQPANEGGTTLTTTEGVVLIELLGAGEVTQQQLSGQLRLDKSRVSRLCSALERKHLVTRHRDEHNRRHLLVRITRHGTAAATRLRRTWQERHERMLGAMTAEERHALLLGLRALHRELDAVHGPDDRFA
ncbi:MarR family winged helix-turn-helix transcriptional regulator [Amycolatopsis alkalitolerans]|uniref:MarR family winged helix-turn-helix transcriptional regulator n=1 Tax=Amycolatopsis alkalitolerans TaxID=2547244 RepID=UPI00135CF039|nr:MarR family winged helix-turn-helix transcriptional regulator [Amycolatopsis alkalitolerans]